jgi:hypothetical protein
MFDRLRESSVQSHRAEQGPDVARSTPPNRHSPWRLAVIGGAVIVAWFFLGPLILKPEFQALVIINRAVGSGQAAAIEATTPAETAKAASVAAAQAVATLAPSVALAASQAAINVDVAASQALIEVEKTRLNTQTQVIGQYLTAFMEVAKKSAELAAITHQQCVIDANTHAARLAGAVSDTSRPWERQFKSETALETDLKNCEKQKVSADEAMNKVRELEALVVTFKTKGSL